MAGVLLKLRTWSQCEASPSLICLALLFLLVSPARARVWYLNDGKTEGDLITRAAGNDQVGDGSEAKPYRTFAQALCLAKEGDTIKLDTGDYDVPTLEKAGEETGPVPVTLSRLGVEGTGPEKTFIHAVEKAGLVFSGGKQINLKEFSLVGGNASLLLDHCSGSSLFHIRTKDSINYGILIKDSRQIKVAECQTGTSGFRGLQFRRSSHNTILKHLSLKNTNAGFCLESSGDNRLDQCRAEGNGLSGFYIFRKSDRNRLENCAARNNKLSGFYLDKASVQNELIGNNSSHNERGFTLNTAPDNLLGKNIASSNDTFGFWIKGGSTGGRIENNQADSNGNCGFIFAPDSPPASFGNNQSRNNRFPDTLPASQTTADLQAKN